MTLCLMGSPGTRGRLLRRVRGRAAALEGRRQRSHGHAGQEVSSVHAAHYTALRRRVPANPPAYRQANSRLRAASVIASTPGWEMRRSAEMT